MIGRPPVLADADAVAALLNRGADADGIGWVTAGEARGWWTAPGVQPENFRVFELDGEQVAYADVEVAPSAPEKGWLDVRVPPEWRGTEVEEHVVAWGEERALQLRAGLLRVFALPDEPLVGTLARRGYRRIRHQFEMEIRLTEEPSPRWPAGIAVRPLAAGEELLAYAPSEEAFQDHWEHTPTPAEEWLHHLTSEGHDPSLWFVALAGEEVAGVCLCRVRVRRGEEFGWCGTLGVRRPWRRLGLGLALLQHAFAEFRRRGLEQAGLGVDGENATGAVRLYERAGMHVVSRTETWERVLG